MKKVYLLVQVFLVLFFISCSEADLNHELSTLANEKVDYCLSQENAIDIAIESLKNLDANSESLTRVASAKWKVCDVYQYPSVTTRTAGEKDFFYIVNFSDGGFAVVPNNEKATDVYALSTEGRFDVEENENLKDFMSRAQEYLYEEVSVVPCQFQPVPPPDDIKNYAKEWYAGEWCYAKRITTSTTPFFLLKTEWNQYEPYRLFCFTSAGEQAAAGCVAVAMAQIMAYHKQPQSYNGHAYLWDEMLRYSYVPSIGAVAESVAYLVNDIGKEVQMQYGTFEKGGSSSNINNAFLGFLTYGFQVTVPQKYNSEKVLESLELNRPVLIRATDVNSGNGEGHEWVVDGYYQESTSVQYYSEETLEYKGGRGSSKKYLHCNWGWSSGNGYFLENVYNINGSSLTKGIEVITDIHW